LGDAIGFAGERSVMIVDHRTYRVKPLPLLDAMEHKILRPGPYFTAPGMAAPT
jgi:hypothetical protein